MANKYEEVGGTILLIIFFYLFFYTIGFILVNIWKGMIYLWYYYKYGSDLPEEIKKERDAFYFRTQTAPFYLTIAILFLYLGIRGSIASFSN